MKYLTIFSLLILFASCGNDDCEQPDEIYGKFNQQTLDNFPIKGENSLRFQITNKSNQITDTVELVGRGFTLEEKVKYDEDIYGEACPKYYYEDRFHIRYSNTDSSQVLLIVGFSGQGSFPEFFLKLNNTDRVQSYIYKVYESNHNCFLGDTAFTDVQYSHVTLFKKGPCAIPFSGEDPQNVFFFDRFFGIVRIETPDETWDLIPF